MWTVEDAARALRVSKLTIYRMIHRGELEYKMKKRRYIIIPIVTEHQLTTRALVESTGYSKQHICRLLKRTNSGKKVGGQYRVPLSEGGKLMLCRFGTQNMDKQ